MTSVVEKGEGMWRTELLIVNVCLCCNGEFPSALLLHCARAKDARWCNAMGALLSLPYYLCTPIYVHGVMH